MPIVMKSSDNGFVDTINKTVRFPSHYRPMARNFEWSDQATGNSIPLGGWTVGPEKTKPILLGNGPPGNTG